jgi:hypothetical protein
LDGKQNVTLSGNTTLPELSNGLHKITVYANDTFGNTGASETIAFNLSKPEPFPLATAIAVVSVATVVAISVGLIIYRRHRKTTNFSKADLLPLREVTPTPAAFLSVKKNDFLQPH